MTRSGEVVARALDLVGTPFRPQGRRREHGLDCLGLVALAANLPLDLVPADYTLREIVSADRFAIDFEGPVTRIDPSEARPGDVLLVLAAARQNHFLVWCPVGSCTRMLGSGES